MSKSIYLTGLVLSVLAITLFLSAGIASETMSKSSKSSEKTVKITGEIVDAACYVGHGAKGESHAKCAETCIESGSPAGILDAKDNLYIVLGENHQSPSEILKGKAGKNVTATGKLIEKGGNQFLVVSKIEETK